MKAANLRQPSVSKASRAYNNIENKGSKSNNGHYVH